MSKETARSGFDRLGVMSGGEFAIAVIGGATAGAEAADIFAK